MKDEKKYNLVSKGFLADPKNKFRRTLHPKRLRERKATYSINRKGNGNYRFKVKIIMASTLKNISTPSTKFSNMLEYYII